MKIYRFIKLLFERFYNKFISGYELTMDDLKNLDGMVTILKVPVENKYHVELYNRACNGCVLSLDLLLKSKDLQIINGSTFKFNDIIIVDFLNQEFKDDAMDLLVRFGNFHSWYDVGNGFKLAINMDTFILIFGNQKIGEIPKYTNDFVMIKSIGCDY